MTIQNQGIEEVRASFGVNAEVADAIDKKAVSPGKVQKNGDQESESIPQGSSLPKTKISMINAVMKKLSEMDKDDVEQQLASMEEAEYEQIDETVKKFDVDYKRAWKIARHLNDVGIRTKTSSDGQGSVNITATHKDPAHLAIHIHRAVDAHAQDHALSARMRGELRASGVEPKRMKKEEYEQMDETEEQIDELSRGTLKSYVKKANKSAQHYSFEPTVRDPESGNQYRPTYTKRSKGIDLAKKKITREDIDVSEDIAAAFSGSDLSEEFKAQATEIFETAVVSSVNMKLAEMAEQAEEEHVEEMQSIEEGLTTKIDEYLDYVVEQWMEENKLAVESGLRSEVTENFLSGLRNLFAENWIDIPEEKVEVVEELAGEVEHLTANLDEEMQKNIELKKQVEKFEREIAFVDVSEGLTEMQIAKFESLAEAVDYEDSESYKERLETIRASFFEYRSEDVTESRTSLDEEFIETYETSEKKLEPNMQMYSAAISRSVKK